MLNVIVLIMWEIQWCVCVCLFCVGQQEYSCSETDEDCEEQTISLSKVTQLGGGESQSGRLAQNKDANSKVCTKTDGEDSCKEESGNSTSRVEEPSVPKVTSCQVKTESDSSGAEFAPNINSYNSRWLSGAAQPQGSSLRSKRATKRKVTDSRESKHDPSLTLSSEKRKKACQSEAAVKTEDDREKVDKESTGVKSRSKKTEDSNGCSGSSLSASASQQASLTKSRTKTKARRRLSSSSVSEGETSDHEDFALQKNSGKRAESKARRRLSSSSVSLGETSDQEDFALQKNLAKRAKTPARRRLLSSLGDSSDLEDFDIQAVSATPLMTTLETTSSSEAAAWSPIAQAPQESAAKPLARRQLRSAPHRNLTSSITGGADLSDLVAFDLPNVGAGLSGSADRGKVKTPQKVAAYSESTTKVSTKRAETKCNTSLASVPHCVVVLSDLKDSGLLDFGAVSVSENKLFQTNLSRARVTRGERVKTDSQQKPVSVSKSVFTSSDGEDVDLPSVDLRARVKVKHEPQPPVPSSDTGLSGQEDGSPDVPCTKQTLPDVYSDKTSSQSKSRNESRFRSEEQVKSQDAEQTSLPHTTRFTKVVSDQTGTSGEDESEMEGHSVGMNTSEPALPQEDKAKDVLDQPSDLSEPSTEKGAVSMSTTSTDEISEEAADRELGQPGRSRLLSTDQELSEEPQSAAETQEGNNADLGVSVGMCGAVEKEKVGMGRAVQKETVGMGRAVQKETVGMGRAVQKERVGMRGVLEGVGMARAVEKERVGMARAVEKERVGMARAVEKERVGMARAVEKETVGMARAVEKERVGMSGAVEKERVGMARAVEKETVGMARAVEKERVGMARAVEKERVGMARAVEKETVGMARAVEKETVGMSGAVEKERVGMARAVEKERVGMARAVEKERVGMARAVEEERVGMRGALEGVGMARAVEKERVGMARAVEKERVGMARAVEKESVGMARAVEKDTVGMARAVEKDTVGMARAVEKDTVGMARAVEKDTVGMARAVEKGTVGMCGAVEKDTVGMARAVEKDTVGMARAVEKGTVGMCGAVEKDTVGMARAVEKDTVGMARAVEKDTVGMARAVEKDTVGMARAVEKERVGMCGAVEKDRVGMARAVEKETSVGRENSRLLTNSSDLIDCQPSASSQDCSGTVLFINTYPAQDIEHRNC